MAVGRVLVIAPQLDLRQSLEFLLEAEGYAVTARPRIEAVDPVARYVCTVLDHRAVVGPEQRVLEFCRMAGPVVLLTSRPIRFLEAVIAGTVEKPHLGGSVPGAVAMAIAARRAT